MDIDAKVIRRGAIAVAAVAVAGALGACSVNGSITATPVTQGTNVSSGAAQNTSSTTGTPQDTSAKGQGVANSNSHPACTNLKVSQTTPDMVGSQWKLPITMTNQGSASCTVQGFPGVRLNGADGTSWDLVRTGDPITPVLLAPGEHATAELTYLTASDGSGWHVSTVSVTPPNGTNTQTIPWADSLDLVKQDGATHPGTYIGPAHAGK